MLSSVMRNPRPPAPFPTETYCTLRYSDAIQLSYSSSPALYSYCLNGCYDPDLINAGHQPYFFDQFCSTTGPYLAYCVLGARVALDISTNGWPAATAGTSPTNATALFAAGPALVSANPPHTVGNVGQLAEIPGWTSVQVNPAVTRKLKFNFDMAKLFGVPMTTYRGEASFSGTASANPTLRAFFHMITQDFTSSADVVNVQVLIEYDVLFYTMAVNEAES